MAGLINTVGMLRSERAKIIFFQIVTTFVCEGVIYIAGVGMAGVGLVSIRENSDRRLCDDRNSNFDKSNDDRIPNGCLL